MPWALAGFACFMIIKLGSPRLNGTNYNYSKRSITAHCQLWLHVRTRPLQILPIQPHADLGKRTFMHEAFSSNYSVAGANHLWGISSYRTTGFRLGADGKGMCPINGVMASTFGKAPWRSHLAQVEERENEAIWFPTLIVTKGRIAVRIPRHWCGFVFSRAQCKHYI